MEKINILGVDITNITFSEGRELVKHWIKNGEKKYYIVTPNPEGMMLARKDIAFKEILNQADLAIPDGAGLVWAGKILGKPFKERISGVDFMLGLCQMAEKEGFSIGLLGAGQGVAEKTAEELKKRFPDLKIPLCKQEWEGSQARPRGLLGSGQGDPLAEIDLLFIAFGMPKQEKWIKENLKNISVKVAMGVGGTFDYLAGEIPRAPKWMRNLGIEWLYRLIKEPCRFKRQLAIWEFGLLVLKEKLLLN